MRSYLDLLEDVLNNGEDHADRTGTGTNSVFGREWRHDMSTGFPLLTTKRVPLRWVFEELRWFLSGSTDVKDLQAQGVTIWDSWLKPLNARELVLVPRRDAILPADYFGDFATKTTWNGETNRKLSGIWRNMMQRCYEPSVHNYQHYGGSGVTVHSRWHDPAVFVEEVKQLPHWQYKQANWNGVELDSDYYGASQYGPDTSVWLSSGENNKYTKVAKAIRVVDAAGNAQYFLSQADAAVGTGISKSSLSRRMISGPPQAVKQGNKRFIGWEFTEVDETEVLLRRELIPDGELGDIYGKQWRDFNGVDQIARLLHDIEHNPNSRRLLVSAWNPVGVPAMALPPCHTLFQLKCHPDNSMSLKLTARSIDIFLGLPFNIASYALLLELLCKVTGRTSRELIISFGDLHLYSNHVGQAKTQLTRGPYPLPRLKLTAPSAGATPLGTAALDQLLGFRWEHIRLHNYRCHPKIRAEVSV